MTTFLYTFREIRGIHRQRYRRWHNFSRPYYLTVTTTPDSRRLPQQEQSKRGTGYGCKAPGIPLLTDLILGRIAFYNRGEMDEVPVLDITGVFEEHSGRNSRPRVHLCSGDSRKAVDFTAPFTCNYETGAMRYRHVIIPTLRRYQGLRGVRVVGIWNVPSQDL
jgi:hypothetical protein